MPFLLLQACLAAALVFVGYSNEIAGAPLKGAKEGDTNSGASLRSGWDTRVDARSLNLEIPAPRGQIVDRNGIPFAQTRVCHFLALQLPTDAGLSDTQIVAIAQRKGTQRGDPGNKMKIHKKK